MKFRFLLNGIEITEPIGFDGFKPVIERTDHHGMSVSVSLNKIGFYGKALEIIDEAYNTDIDTVLQFVVQINRDEDWFNIYSGVVDLASCELVSENGSCIINCNIGEIGVKTTFNNRYDTKVELNRETSLDDDPLPNYPMLKRNIEFPSKEILLTNKAGYDLGNMDYILGVDRYVSKWWFFVPLGDIKSNEIEYFNSEMSISQIDSLTDIGITDGIINAPIPDGSCVFVFLNNEQNRSVLGSPVDFNINIRINFSVYISVSHMTGFNLFIYHCNSNGTVKKILLQKNYSESISTISTLSIDDDISFDNNGEPLSMKYGEKIAVLFFLQRDIDFHDITTYSMNYGFGAETGISITALSKLRPTNQNVLLIHESLSIISEIISGLTVKSDWYGRIDSNVNPTNGFGGGSLKAILNGYELRNMNLTSGERPPIKLSFKDLFESLNAIDNIGWGFSEEKEGDDDVLYLRMERWKWFYKDDVIMEINSPNNVKRSMQADKIYTGLKIGYSKSLDEKEINAIDTFHTDREYYTGLKAVDVKLEKLCKFIADPYAIEVTRRQQFNSDTTNWKYDEDVFIVALHYFFIDANAESYNLLGIDIGITDDSGTIISPETMYNVRISPQRNAIRWAERFFEVISHKDSLDYTAGTGNVTAKGKPSKLTPGGLHFYLEDSGSGEAISERDNISRKAPLLKPEILSFDYPITFEQYAAILANPYGKITVDGEECYIQKVTPTLIGNIASFELIPKNV